MKKFLFIVTIVALVMGTAVDAGAKKKKGQGKKKAQTTQTIKSNNKNMKVDQGMYTAEDANRLANGDVADLEKAYISDFYGQYVFNGNIYNDAYLPYVKIKFSKPALSQLAKADGSYDWSVITGRTDESIGITPDYFIINRLDGNWFEVCGADGFKTYLKVEGSDGAYKITQVSKTKVN